MIPQTINYGFMDPCLDFGEAPASDSTDFLPRPWPSTLHSYRLGHRLEQNAWILPIGVAIGDRWFCDCIQYLPKHWPQASWMANLAGLELVVHGDQTLGYQVRLEAAERLKPERLDGQWCVLNDLVAHRNLGHFFHDLLPQLVAIRRLKARWPNLQVIGNPERLRNLRILRELLLEQNWHARPARSLAQAAPLEVEELVLQPVAFNGGVGFFGRASSDWWLAIDDFREGLQLLRNALRPNPTAIWQGQWIFFSRDLAAATEAPQGRQFSNYPQLLEALSNRGVVVIDPGFHDIRQLQVLVAEAKGFVGIHGAGLFNGLLGRPGARLIEIRPACGCWRSLELLSLSAGHDWRLVACEADADKPGQSVIPIKAVLGLLDERSGPNLAS